MSKKELAPAISPMPQGLLVSEMEMCGNPQLINDEKEGAFFCKRDPDEIPVEFSSF
jgi:hypothetical protein